MKHLLFLCTLLPLACLAEVWPLDSVDGALLLHGDAGSAPGAVAQSLVLDGASVIELKNSSALASGSSFTASVWFNPYSLHGGQQMLIGKNRYSLGERQWGITVEPDGRLRAHLQQKKRWSEITCAQPLQPGRWHLATLVVTPERAALYLNGQPAGEIKLTQPIPATAAPVTLGGIFDEGRPRQQFIGALDDARIEPHAMSAADIAAAYHPVEATHDLPKSFTADFPLWDATQKLPASADLPLLQGTDFHVIKKQAPDADGARWTLGVGLAWHKGKLYASYGFNKGSENTPTEEAHVRVSEDAGHTWGPPVVMDSGEGSLGVSHGVFLSHKDKLWAFMGAFYDRFQRTHTCAYTLNETTGAWEPHGMIIDSGFWPMQEPQKMADGNWIMAGARVSKGYDFKGDLPAVAISHGDDFTRWDLVVIPVVRGLGNVWGECSVIVEGSHIINISRYGQKAQALVSSSEDCGRTWKPSAPSNLPMATSKPYAGTLSTGQRYLVCTTTADTGGRRSPLTIAVSRPGENVFSQVFLIRPSVFAGTPGVSDPKADFSYPYAVEHEGRLYIGYTHKSHAANELAVVPVASLTPAAAAKTKATRP
ncbi:LamG-like jellyroll fold domain-containing protein [Prosthecobacter sp.]|uniref:LamG-like jellyroll fold domain-containing protein n=1 Tax=Prosthecobacter sp. TaxID=1965333 RepID=UPI00378433C1